MNIKELLKRLDWFYVVVMAIAAHCIVVAVWVMIMMYLINQ